MRTTLVLEDGLLRQAKARAAAQGTTLSEMVSQALRRELAEEVARPEAFQMLVFGERGTDLRHEPKDFHDPAPPDARPRHIR